ncbi:Pantothenate kinase [Plasmodiophora brassicae]|uniref:pantothenate kinase n=2 Tax=Plasmodiophora brassicae TaxID=37360 RepID=A0A3P3Y5T5_PLABS|nr:unnamed protein product [Plasmodiophora brassicae]
MSSGENDDEDGYRGLLENIRHLLMERRPADPLRYLQTVLDERIEQRDVRRLGSSGENLAPPGGLVKHWDAERSTFLGVDVGGSLSKITFFESNDDPDSAVAAFVKRSERYGSTGFRDPALSFEWRNGRFHFLTFETRRMEGAIEMMRANGLLKTGETLLATGGGAHKFSETIRSRLGLCVVKGDELHCLLWGINFLVQHTRDECYYFANPQRPSMLETAPFDMTQGSAFPYLLVNIGSGVSILKVDSNDSFQRVSGTMMGGGTFWGLCRLLTKCKTFEEAVELASSGDTTKLNMLVRDIYGGAYEAFGLSADTVASAFGLLGVSEEARNSVTEADIARGLLDMIAQNIAQLAYLCARKYHLTRLLFVGNFLRKNPLSMGSISFSIDYWSRGVARALFLRHEGYFGSTGAFFIADDDPVVVPRGALSEDHRTDAQDGRVGRSTNAMPTSE